MHQRFLLRSSELEEGLIRSGLVVTVGVDRIVLAVVFDGATYLVAIDSERLGGFQAKHMALCLKQPFQRMADLSFSWMARTFCTGGKRDSALERPGQSTAQAPLHFHSQPGVGRSNPPFGGKEGGAGAPPSPLAPT